MKIGEIRRHRRTRFTKTDVHRVSSVGFNVGLRTRLGGLATMEGSLEILPGDRFTLIGVDANHRRPASPY